MQNLLIRELREQDVADILKIEKESFTEPWSEELLKREVSLPFSRFLVAEGSGRVVGYLIAWIVDRTCDVNRIAVLPEYRRKGVGKRLLGKLLEMCSEEGVEEIFLEVKESNIAAVKLYEGFGFKKIGIRKGYYGGENAVVFCLNPFSGGRDA